MAGWTRHSGRAFALAIDNIDTDQLIPARFMATPRAQGYGQYLLHDMRHDADGRLDPDFALNRPEAEGASILIARRNFGSGSSREAAVYALVDAGFRCVIAPSFGDIFAGNAVNNGLLPACVSEAMLEALIAAAPLDATINLETGSIDAGGINATFDLKATWRMKLIKGWDDIDLTASHHAEIAAYAQARRADRRWLWPPAG